MRSRRIMIIAASEPLQAGRYNRGRGHRLLSSSLPKRTDYATDLEILVQCVASSPAIKQHAEICTRVKSRATLSHSRTENEVG